MRAVGGVFLVAAGFAALCHCSEKYGTGDAALKDSGAPDSSSSNTTDAGAGQPPDAAPGVDAAADASAPAPVSLATNLNHPNGLFVDGANVFVTVQGEDRVITVPKDGSAAPRTLAATQTQPYGVVTHGGFVYWANRTFPADGEPAHNGGLWRCDFAKCSSTTDLVTEVGEWPQNPVRHNDTIFYAADNDFTIHSINVDAGTSKTLHSVTHPFAIAVDDTHVYFNSNDPKVKRMLHDGGSPTEIGPFDAEYFGYIALDETRFYWAYGGPVDIGHVYGALKSDPENRVEYGTDNKRASGVAVDATRIYWIDAGTGRGGVSDKNGRLLSCLKSGCVGSPTVLASGLRYGGAVALDSDYVYFLETGDQTTATGAVWKVKKL